MQKAITTRTGAHKFHTRAAARNIVRKLYRSGGTHLVIVNLTKGAGVIGNLHTKSGPHFSLEDSNYAHIGVPDLYEEGEFLTVDGKSLAIVGFYERQGGEPSNDVAMKIADQCTKTASSMT